MELKKIGVVGAGMMGSEIALCFAMNGYETILGDINLDQYVLLVQVTHTWENDVHTMEFETMAI